MKKQNDIQPNTSSPPFFSSTILLLNVLGAFGICVYFIIYIHVYVGLVFLGSILLTWYVLLTKVFFSTPTIDWEKERIWVTGGSQGVGKAFIELLSKVSQGQTQILLLDCEPPDPTWLATFHDHVQYQFVNLSTLSHQPELIASWIQTYQAPTMLVNNAGTMVGKYLTDLTVEDMQRVIQVNLMAPMILTKEVLPFMLKNNHGHVLHVASACGLTGLAWLTDYCASKFGLVGFNEALRQELLNTNVNTSVICPAQIGTRLFSCTQPKYPWLCPILSPEEVAQTMLNILLKKSSKVKWMPLFVHNAVLVMAVPTWLNDWAHGLLGANELHPAGTAPY